jgi:hypothetical protein
MKHLIIALFISFFLSITIFAQYGSDGTADARSMSLGKTSNAISTGVYSIGINPANLISTNPDGELSTVLPFPHLSVSASTNFLTIQNYNYYFGGVGGSGRILNNADKQNLNSLFQNGGIVSGSASFTLLSFGIYPEPSIGAFGFSVNDFIECDFTVPRSLSNILLNGDAQNTVYNFDDTKFNSWYLRNYSLSYAREFGGISGLLISSLSAGVTIKYYQGFAFVHSIEVKNNSITTGANNQININSNYTVQSAFSDDFNVKYSFDSTKPAGNPHFNPFPSPAGTGYGFDIGINACLNDNWNISLAVTDIGNITWNKNTALTTSAGQYSITDLFDKAQQDSIKNKFKGNSVNAGSITTELPTTIRFGAAHKFYFSNGSFPGTLLLAMDLNQGFNNEPGNSTNTRISFGGGWQLADGFPIIRTGFSFGGAMGFHWGIGLGYDTGLLEFNLATLDLQSLAAPNSAKILSVALDSRWKF